MLPAAVFVEEVLEASLSRLSRYCGTDLRTHTVEQFSDAYASLGPGPQLADCSHPHLAATLPPRVLIRLDKTLNALRAGCLPEVVGTGVKGQGTTTSTATIFVPRSPLHGLDEGDVSQCLYHAVYTMLCAEDLEADVKASAAELSRMVPSLDAVESDRVRHVHAEAKKRLREVLKKPTPTRRSTTRGQNNIANTLGESGTTTSHLPPGVFCLHIYMLNLFLS